jgi:KaiC/GvpD/RAD55 family RecA-like ATPase
MPMTPAELAEKLSELPPSSSVSLRFKADGYFDAIRSIVDIFGPKNDLNVIYITASMPSHSMIEVLEMLEIDMKRIYFVDCISHIMMGAQMKHENVIFVESPTMLENIMLKVEYLMRKTKDKKHVILLDSINSLAIHNNPKILSEFLHIFVNNFRSKGAYTIVFAMDEYVSEEIMNILFMVIENAISMSDTEA